MSRILSVSPSALSQATSDDHEARFNLLAEVVEILESECARTSNNISLRLLDPRYQMSFFAEEIDSQTFSVRDVPESSRESQAVKRVVCRYYRCRESCLRADPRWV